MSASEKGIVEDVIFSGSRLDVVVNINGIKVTAERSLEKDPVSVGEEVDIIIYRLYVFDEKETYLLENKRNAGEGGCLLYLRNIPEKDRLWKLQNNRSYIPMS